MLTEFFPEMRGLPSPTVQFLFDASQLPIERRDPLLEEIAA